MSPRPRVRPPAVPAGGVLGVCAPAGPVNADRLHTGLSRLADLGFQLRLAPGILERQGFLAGDDATRASDFLGLWRDPEVDAVLCARGGYGALRLLRALDGTPLSRGAKALVGFSDITALHQLLARHGVVSFHGLLVEAPEGGPPPADIHALVRALTQTDPLGEIPWPSGGPDPVCVVPGRAEGPLVGGNLSLLAATAGTPWELQPAGCLLLLEDVGERPYTLDRYLTQLFLAGHLEAATGFVIGEFIDCTGGADEPTALQVVTERLGRLGKPCLANLPLGHGAHKLTVPLGVRAVLDAGAARLEFVEPALT